MCSTDFDSTGTYLSVHISHILPKRNYPLRWIGWGTEIIQVFWLSSSTRSCQDHCQTATTHFPWARAFSILSWFHYLHSSRVLLNIRMICQDTMFRVFHRVFVFATLLRWNGGRRWCCTAWQFMVKKMQISPGKEYQQISTVYFFDLGSSLQRNFQLLKAMAYSG